MLLYSLFVDTGWIMIDRSGTYFGTIMNYLRDGTVVLPDSQKGITELLAEAKYYCITELADTCERALRKIEPEPICRVPLITSQKEEQMLISTSTKVRVCGLYLQIFFYVNVVFDYSNLTARCEATHQSS